MKLARLIFVFWLYTSSTNVPNCGVNALWYVFTSSPSYANTRMTTDEDASTVSLRYLKVSAQMSKFWATVTCVRACALRQSCKAFTLHETDAYYSCELLPGNMCNNGTSTILSSMNGSTVWDKLSTSPAQACLEQKFKNTTIPCQDLRPGCLGLWPNCYNCTRTCIDCHKRYGFYTGYKACTLWPEGDSPSTIPVNGQCYRDTTLLIRRQINQTTGQLTTDFRMPFKDMSRLCTLKTYRFLRFNFFPATNLPYYVSYRDICVDSNGTLQNVSTNPLHFLGIKDLLQINASTPKSIPFVTVTNDIYGCGSFWLVNTNNATYCPGGNTTIFGPVNVNGTKVESTGIQYAEDIFPYLTFYSFELLLSNI